MLIEVIISALLVSFLVIGTFDGFEAATNSTGNSRAHDEAAVLAAESQDQLRSLPAASLDLLASVTEGHSYTAKVAGSSTEFTVKQQAHVTGGAEGSAGCSVTEEKSQVSNAMQITSTVTWKDLKQPEKLVESSIITPPTGSALEVDVGNAPGPTEGVSEVTIYVTYTPVGSSTPYKLEATTGTAGCVVFGGLPTDSATVEIPEKVGYVTPSGALKPKAKELTLAPNTTTHDAVTFNRGGSLTANFQYEGKTTGTFTHPNNSGSGSVTEKVTGDTFVAFNPHMESGKDYEVGSTTGSYITGNVFEAQPASKNENFKQSATTPIATPYPAGDLFPFLKSASGNWKVYAGDCAKNDPEEVTKGQASPVKDPLEVVSVGGPTNNVAVPMSYTMLNLYKGQAKEAKEQGYKDLEVESSLPVAITNTSCAGNDTPDNESAVNLKHVQSTTTETANEGFGGHLTAPFQPFGAYQLCVFDEHKDRDTYTVSRENLTEAGSTVNIYLSQKSEEERVEDKHASEVKESETRTKREKAESETEAHKQVVKEETSENEALKKENTAKTKWESEETTEASKKASQESELTTWSNEEKTHAKEKETAEASKKTREAKEKTERETWVKEEKEKKISEATRKSRETSQTNTRKTDETKEAETAKTRENAEKATTTKRNTTESAIKTRELEEGKTKEYRAKEESGKSKRVSEEAATKEKANELKKHAEEELKAEEKVRTTREGLEAEEVKEIAQETKEGTAVTINSHSEGC